MLRLGDDHLPGKQRRPGLQHRHHGVGWGLDDYFTGIQANDGINNGPAIRTQCGYPWFHPDLISCRNPAIEQITRNVLNWFITGN